MRRKAISRLLLLVLIFFSIVSPVRPEKLPVTIFTSADGLGSGFVDYLMRDSRGLLWFCTRDGLSSFDGARFITYRIGGETEPPGVESIAETRDGTYWISTTGGLYRFRASSVVRRPDASRGRPTLNAKFVGPYRGVILEGRAGDIWLGSDGLLRLKLNGDRVDVERIDLHLPDEFARMGVSEVHEAPDGSIWLTNRGGFIRRLPDGRVIFYPHDSLLRYTATSLGIEDTGRVWIARSGELFVMQPERVAALSTLGDYTSLSLHPTQTFEANSNSAIQLPEAGGEIFKFAGGACLTRNPTHNIFQTTDKRFWISSDQGLIEFDGRMFHMHRRDQGLPSGIARMIEDVAGNLWMCGQSGVARLNRYGITSFTEAEGLKSPYTYSIREDPTGAIYVATADYYVSRFDGSGFRSVRLAVSPNSIPLWTSRSAFLDSRGEWWALTDKGLYHYPSIKNFAESNSLAPLTTYDAQNGLWASAILQMFEDSRGEIFVSLQPSKAVDRGLARWDRKTQQFQRFTEAEGFPAGRTPISFAEDAGGNLWFGFYEGGIARFENNRFTVFGEKEGVPDGLIAALLFDRKGRLWLASTAGGLGRSENPLSETPTFSSMTAEAGLSTNNLRALAEDQFGNIYLGTVRGVDRLTPETMRVKHYSIADGLAGDFVVDAHRDRAGALWFATTSGLSRFVPAVEEKTAPPPIWVNGLRVAGVAQQVSWLGDTNIAGGEFGHTQNNLQIDFFGLDFHSGETLRYQYFLEGADADWSPPTEQRTVTYANLRPGRYRFMVRAINSDGFASEQPAIISFRILAPIWARWWFVTLAVLACAAIAVVFYRYRTARLREVNAALEEAKRAEENLGEAREERLTELSRVRTRIATDLHDDIGASLTQIAILSEVAKQQSMKGNGAAIEPLNSIVSVSNELVETMSDIVWAINPQKDHLQDLIQRMRRFASDILLAKHIGLDFNAPTYAPEIPLGANARREVFLIFKESIANIVKHAGATRVKINFDFSANYLTLRIFDNGSGFDPYNIQPALSVRAKGGHGIFSMRKRAAEMNGSIDITSAPGKGTTIEFRLPFPEQVAMSPRAD